MENIVFSIPEWGYTTVIELVWTVLAICGTVYSFTNMIDARRDIVAVADVPESALTMLYDLLYTNVRTRTVVLGLFAAVGIFACALPSPTGPNTVPLSGLLTILGLIAGEAMLVIASRTDRIRRRRLRHALDT